MKKFLIKVLFFSFPILILLISVNFLGDAAKIFNSNYEIRMAEIILNGNYVKNISNYDERIFQKELIPKMKKAPEIIVLGSSRAILLSGELFPGKKIFNNSVSGASIEDLIAIYQIYKEHDLIPDKIILGIDPWIFNENNGQNRWQSIESFYDNFFKERSNTTTKTFPSIKLRQLVSISYFQPSFKNLLKKLNGNSKPEPTTEKNNDTNTKLTDGSLVYNSDYRKASQEEINSKIMNYNSGIIYGLNDFNSISEEKWNEFQALVNNIKKENINVEFFLSPYAPSTYELILKKYINVSKTEKMIKKFAINNEIKIYGSYNPFMLGFDNTYFYDAMHCKEKGITHLLKN